MPRLPRAENGVRPGEGKPDAVKAARPVWRGERQKPATARRSALTLPNDWVSEADAVVFTANDRCDQENLLAQLSGGVRALRAPVDNLESNGAYRVMTAQAWN